MNVNKLILGDNLGCSIIDNEKVMRHTQKLNVKKLNLYESDR